jgi:predicted ATP-grasp superfamily ATP-dependent carboligase
VIHTRDELLAIARRLPAETGSWLIQEIIPGAESRITLAAGYAGGSVDTDDIFTARKLRQYPAGFGSASRAISCHCSDTEATTRRLIDAIGYRGLYGAEFKRDPRDGALKIIEINPRPTLWFHLSHAAGKRLVATAYCAQAGIPLPVRTAQRDGILWQYTLKDWASALFYRFRGEAFVFPRPDLRAGGRPNGRCWPVFSVADPLPLLAECYVYASKFMRRLF